MTPQVSNTQKLIKGVSSQSIVTVILGVVEILSFSIMSRLLTQEDFGYYAAITAITTVFASFSETGIGSALIQRKNLSQNYVNNAFTISFLFGFFISVLLFFLSRPLSRLVLDNTLIVPLRIMSVTLICNCLVSVNFSLLQRELKFLRIGVINLISLVITTIVAIILAQKGYGYYAILTKAVLTSVLTLALSFIFQKKRFNFEIDIRTFHSIFSFSGWLMASAVFRNLAQQIDRLLMGRLLSVTALGAYNRPKDFINQISAKVNGIFDTALFPVLSGIQDNKTSLSNAYIKSFYYLNLFAMVLATAFVFNHELIIRVFLGEQWMSVKSVFIVLSVALVFNIDGRLSDCFFRSLGLTREQFFFRIIELIVKVIALIIGSHWDLLGIAASVVMANLIMIVVKTIYISTQIGVSLRETFITILESWQFSIVAIPIMLTMCFLLPHTWPGNIILALVYLLVILLLFLVFPSVVGWRYQKEAYGRIVSFLDSKIPVNWRK